jgi:hypothetical protein
MNQPRRAVILELNLQADSREALLTALMNIERRIASGDLLTGVSGGPDSGYIYHYEERDHPTHEEYVQQLKDWVRERV